MHNIDHLIILLAAYIQISKRQLNPGWICLSKIDLKHSDSQVPKYRNKEASTGLRTVVATDFETYPPQSKGQYIHFFRKFT